MAIGDDDAGAVGVDVSRVRWLLLVTGALLTGALVAVSGAIGFVGLLLPHATRLVVGRDHRFLLPAVALAGASFLVWVDTLRAHGVRPAGDPGRRRDGAHRRAGVRVPAGPPDGAAVSIDARGIDWSAAGRLIVNGVDCHVEPGSLVGVIGPNGSGKSSFLRCLAGLRTADDGVVLVQGDTLAESRPARGRPAARVPRPGDDRRPAADGARGRDARPHPAQGPVRPATTTATGRSPRGRWPRRS